MNTTRKGAALPPKKDNRLPAWLALTWPAPSLEAALKRWAISVHDAESTGRAFRSDAKTSGRLVLCLEWGPVFWIGFKGKPKGKPKSSLAASFLWPCSVVILFVLCQERICWRMQSAGACPSLSLSPLNTCATEAATKVRLCL